MNPTLARGKSWAESLSPEIRSEFEQAALRVAIVGIVLVYLTMASLLDGGINRDEQQVLVVAVGTFLFALALGWQIARSTHVSVARRFVGMVADNAVTTYCLIQMDEAGAVIIGVYLFVAFGNGFRYGRFYLHTCQIMGLLGFCLVLVASNYWRNHTSLSAGVIIAMIVLPFYVGVLTKRITEAKRRADEANRAKGRFLANVSHEMRTPLNGVIAMADVLRETSLADAQHEIVETMTTSAHLLLAQIEDVLDMAKIEAGRVQIERRPFSLSDLVSSTIKVMQPQARYKGIDLALHQSNDTAKWFIGDAHHIRQVALNLLANAIKFTERGEVTVRVMVSGEESPLLRIEVEDTGIGIPAAKQALIFEPFTQADDSITRVYGGTGLGTTIAKHLVVQMGGSIGLVSTEGVGSIFWFELPLIAAEGLERNGDLPDATHRIRGYSTGNGAKVGRRAGAKILVAEDNATNRRVAQLILESGQHTVTTVTNGEEALDALEAEEFDLALFDLSMPRLSGIQALKLYLFSTPSPIPVLVLSANVTPEAIAECTRAGAAEFIAKPLRASVLLDAVERHLTGNKVNNIHPAQNPMTEPRSLLSLVDSPLLDMDVLQDLGKLSPDPTFVSRLIEGFRGDAERLTEEIKEGLISQNFEGVTDAAHALKGGAGSVGAVQLMNLAIRIEKAGSEQLRLRSTQFSNELEKVCMTTLEGLASHLHRRLSDRPSTRQASNTGS